MLARFSFDADYVRRLSEGDAETEDHFARYFGDLIRIKASARLRSGHGADDIRQETLLRVLRTLRKGAIEHPERLGAYVNTVCNNVMLETFRRDKRLTELPEGEIPSGQAGAESGLLSDERRDLVRRALNELPAKDRELLQRIFLDEHDKDVVCEEFRVSREYLRVLLHRARIRLRTALHQGRGRAAG
ncbi:MAG: sigma-70 family RNA polymerase sigma factor [Acidobacteriia bacterium]|nr:sigma-70 family RNA polymerase sigma factor [Terriglobia bacterium]